jgi:hypothetical protein
MLKSNLSINPVKLARYLFFVAASVLLIFGVGTLLRINQNPEQIVMYLFYAILFFGKRGTYVYMRTVCRKAKADLLVRSCAFEPEHCFVDHRSIWNC